MADLLLGGHDSLPMSLVVCEKTDALATAYMLIKGSAHSPMMQFIHTQAPNVPQFVVCWDAPPPQFLTNH